jgi:hypothetical protein
MDYTLWIAYYPGHDLQANEPPIQVQGWPNWTFWQYSSKGRVDGVMNDDGTQPQGVDLNIFNGSSEDLQSYLTNSNVGATQQSSVTNSDPTQSPTLAPLGTGFINKAIVSTWGEPNSKLIERLGLLQPITLLEKKVVGGDVWYRCSWEKDGSTNEGWILADNISFGTPPATPTFVIPGQSSGVPLIETVNVNTHPPIPEELKEGFMIGPDSLDSSTTTNVIKFNGLTYWAYSYDDNRLSLGIVAYDSSNNIIKQWEKSGARYLWKITVDSKSQTVVFHGQDSNTIVVKWSDLVP